MSHTTVFRSVVLLLAAANVFGLYLGLTQRAMVLGMCARLEDVWSVYLASPIVTLIGLAALWGHRRWGAWLSIGMGVAVLALELYGCGLAPHVMRVPLAMALLAVVVWANQRALR